MAVAMKDLGIEKLSIDDRVILAEEIRASIEAEIASSQVPEWHLEIIRERLAKSDLGNLAIAVRQELRFESNLTSVER